MDTSTFLLAYAKTFTQDKKTEEEGWEPYGGGYTQDCFIDLADRDMISSLQRIVRWTSRLFDRFLLTHEGMGNTLNAPGKNN